MIFTAATILQPVTQLSSEPQVTTPLLCETMATPDTTVRVFRATKDHDRANFHMKIGNDGWVFLYNDQPADQIRVMLRHTSQKAWVPRDCIEIGKLAGQLDIVGIDQLNTDLTVFQTDDLLSRTTQLLFQEIRASRQAMLKIGMNAGDIEMMGENSEARNAIVNGEKEARVCYYLD